MRVQLPPGVPPKGFQPRPLRTTLLDWLKEKNIEVTVPNWSGSGRQVIRLEEFAEEIKRFEDQDVIEITEADRCFLGWTAKFVRHYNQLFLQPQSVF